MSSVDDRGNDRDQRQALENTQVRVYIERTLTVPTIWPPKIGASMHEENTVYNTKTRLIE